MNYYKCIKHCTTFSVYLTDEQVVGLMEKINPYGRTIEGSGEFTCLSIYFTGLYETCFNDIFKWFFVQSM